MLTALLRIQCPTCRAAYQVGAEKIGKPVRCRKCDRSWKVADPAAAPKAGPRTGIPAPVAEAPAKSARTADRGGGRGRGPGRNRGLGAVRTPAVAEPPQAAKPAAEPAKAPAPKKPAVAPEAVEADAFFKSPRVVELSLEIAPGDYEALKREPRKYVKATLKEGDKT